MKPVRMSRPLTIDSEPSGLARRSAGGAEPRRSRAASGGRAGATLTEVLMAILIMAVGVVSVFTLFPISVLRTVQATQQTNSKIHKLNAQETVKAVPSVLTSFQVGTTIGRPPQPVLGPFNYLGQWQPQTAYAIGDVVLPTLRPGQVRPTPFVMYTVQAAGTSATDEPAWMPQSVVPDGGVTWEPILDGAGIPVSYVVDPLGYNLAIDDATAPPARFGNKTDVVAGTGVTPAGESLLRIHGGLPSTDLATVNVAQLDSWEEVVSGTPVSATNGTVVFPPTIDLAGAGGAIRRMVVTSSDGQMTVYRLISNIAAPSVNLAEPIPIRFPRDGGGNPDIGTARIESLTRRYTWFLTVRNNAVGNPDIKCVVVFNRNFASASEHVYDANFGNGVDIDIDNFGGPDGAQHGLSGNNWVKIAWPATEPKPLLKSGNWVFDARDVTWYRVQEVFEEGTGGGVSFAVLLLDRGVRRTSQPALPLGQAILMPGVVEVFNL